LAAAGVSLEAAVRTRVELLELDASLSIDPGELVVLLGPNGAGKTTLLRALAGLVALDEGRVTLDGEVLEDSHLGTRVPPERRSIGFVFQDYLLFPHMTVVENVAFGLRARGMRTGEARKRAREWLEEMGLTGYESAQPRMLSGGQAQRVALARALAVGPRLLLLDEPFAALDASARVELRAFFRDRLASVDGPRLVVTHDPVEAMVLGDRLIVLQEGRITQMGSPDDLRARPRTPYVADLVGMNLYRGRARGGRIELPSGGRLAAPDAADGEVFAAVHARAVALYRSRPDGTPRNLWEATVKSIDREGERVRARLSGPLPVVAEITSGAAADLALAVGSSVWVSIKATEVVVYPA
jgi:molybdate transport system ATP-binding protein